MNKKETDFLKKEYESIKAPESLKREVNNIMNEQNNKRKSPLKLIAAVAAGVVVVSAVTLNISPTIAMAASDIPGLGKLVNIVTFNRFAEVENDYEYNVNVPKISDLQNNTNDKSNAELNADKLTFEELENTLNKSFENEANIVLDEFQNNIKALKEEYPDTDVHMGLDHGYDVIVNNDKYFVINIYTLITSGSSMTTNNYYTIDRTKGELVTLESLFKSNEDYVSKISKYLLEEMTRLNKDGEIYFIDSEMEDSFKEINKDQNFYINEEENLVICFDKYEVASGAEGEVQFIIPTEVISNILK